VAALAPKLLHQSHKKTGADQFDRQSLRPASARCRIVVLNLFQMPDQSRIGKADMPEAVAAFFAAQLQEGLSVPQPGAHHARACTTHGSLWQEHGRT
jgi:hypothetical protein